MNPDFLYLMDLSTSEWGNSRERGKEEGGEMDLEVNG